MSFQELKKLRNNSTLQPRPEWFWSTRQELVKKVELHQPDRRPLWSLTWLEMRYSFINFSPKIVSLLVMIGLVGGVVAKANVTIRPDSPYYVVKQTIEEITLAVALNPTDKALLLIKHSQKRQDEAIKLSKDETLKPEEKARFIGVAAKAIENNLTAAKANLDIANTNTIADQDQTTGSNSVTQVAKEISVAAKGAVTNLQQVQKELVSTVLSTTNASSTQAEVNDAKNTKDQLVKTLQVINSAANQVGIVETQSLKTLVEKVDSPIAADNSKDVSKAEVNALVADKINRVEATVDQMTQVIKKAEGTTAQKDVTNQANGVTLPVVLPKEVAVTSSVVVLTSKDAKDAGVQSNKAKEVIVEAKKDLSQKDDLTAAVNKLEQAEKMNGVSQVVIEKAATVITGSSTTLPAVLQLKPVTTTSVKLETVDKKQLGGRLVNKSPAGSLLN